MAGFFGLFNYEKPGPGVSKDEPEKHRIFVFFELYFRRLTKLIQANLLFCVFCIPFVIPFALVVLFFGSHFTFVHLLALLPLAGIGPAIAGLTYILRNFARQQHAFIWMDFKDTAKSNWKQAVIVTLINILVGGLLYISCTFYYGNLSENVILAVPFGLCLLGGLLLLFIQYYLYTMMITFSLTIKQLYKNAVIFAIIGLFRNILTTVFCLIAVILASLFLPLLYVLIPLLLISTIGFIINFNSWPLIDKHMMQPLTEGTEPEPTERVFDDNNTASH